MLRNIMLLACIALLSGMQLQAQESGLPIADVYKQAIEKGSRTSSGKPGQQYFQNRSDYQIKARLEPSSRTLSGTVQIQYQNNSPDALDQIVLRLYQDMYKRGFESDDNIAEEDQTDGVEIFRVVLNGKGLEAARLVAWRYIFHGTDGLYHVAEIGVDESTDAHAFHHINILVEHGLCLRNGSHKIEESEPRDHGSQT